MRSVRRVTSPDPVNLAFGSRRSLLDVLAMLGELLGEELELHHRPPRPGDVRHSQADHGRLQTLFPDVVPVEFRTALTETVAWFRTLPAYQPDQVIVLPDVVRDRELARDGVAVPTGVLAGAPELELVGPAPRARAPDRLLAVQGGSGGGALGEVAHDGPRLLHEDVQPDGVYPPLRIHLSPPDVGPTERALLLEAFDSGWVAPVGPHLDAFERELAARVGVPHAVALSSGTAGLHLALLLAGVGPGDRVLCSDLTFVATANAIRYVGAEPVFVDADPATWNLDVDLVAQELATGLAQGRPYAAVLAVDLYGRCCDYTVLEPLCAEYGATLIEDAAEALGASHAGRAAGSFGRFGVLSFNGNKICTTSGGGALVTADGEAAERARYLATQARDPAPHYQHSEIGHNYRMSNLLAAVGLGQLRTLDEKLARRRQIQVRYRERLAGLPGVSFAPSGEDGSNAWLTCITIDPVLAGVTREEVRFALRRQGIEARPVWKPMHLQPLFVDAPIVGEGVAARLFDHGLCLPTGSSLTAREQDEVCDIVREAIRA
jgi:dTDP-4-amino-4,6-dideoxygalactose transaminase